MTAFDDFDGYLSLDRVTGLALSHDGNRLVASVARLNKDGNKFVTSLWEIDPAGRAEARRLTHSEQGESGPVFTPDGALLFTSTREAEDDAPAALWRLPAGHGEARRVLTRPGGIETVAAARESGTVVIATSVLPGSGDAEADDKRRKQRKDAKVKAVLYTESPVRIWDHDLGPDEVHLQALRDLDGDELKPVQLTPTPGRALDEPAVVLTPDGHTAITSWNTLPETGMPVAKIVAVDTATGRQRVLAEDEDATFGSPAVSRDGRQVICVRERLTDYDRPPEHSLWLVDLETGTGRELVNDPDIWPAEPQFSADGAAVYFLTDEDGHRPVFRLDLATEQITRMTDSGHFTNLQVAPDGTLYALRDHVDHPPTPVRIDADGTVTTLPAPGTTDVPGHIERVSTTAADGTQVSGWLALPNAEGPAPLLLWIHGGPLSSWNSWSWRWNPWLMVAKGYAVLLPDPAFSTGYGARMVQRGGGSGAATRTPI